MRLIMLTIIAVCSFGSFLYLSTLAVLLNLAVDRGSLTVLITPDALMPYERWLLYGLAGFNFIMTSAASYLIWKRRK